MFTLTKHYLWYYVLMFVLLMVVSGCLLTSIVLRPIAADIICPQTCLYRLAVERLDAELDRCLTAVYTNVNQYICYSTYYNAMRTTYESFH